MNNEQPLELALNSLQAADLIRHAEYRFISTDFAFANRFLAMEPVMFQMHRPYRLKEGRIILPTNGTARVSVNLIEYTITPQVMGIVPPGAITQFLEFSPDFDFRMILPSVNFIQLPRKEDLFENYLLNNQQGIAIVLNEEEQIRISAYFSLIWDTLQSPIFHRETVRYLVTALLCEASYIRKQNQYANEKPLNRQEELFQRFIGLVNQFSKSERTVSFYADKLYLTPRYLNTAIRQVSQQTVMDWVNQSVTLEAQVLLRHSDKLIYQIADELNFPNPSFFCKFFKRMTGITPQEYQKQNT